jgi:hypothetical protein
MYKEESEFRVLIVVVKVFDVDVSVRHFLLKKRTQLTRVDVFSLILTQVITKCQFGHQEFISHILGIKTC